MVMALATIKKYCRWCSGTKADHAVDQPWTRRCMGFQPQPAPSCRVCGSGFDPGKSGRDDCCYRHRLDS